jgi:hypothetical protein
MRELLRKVHDPAELLDFTTEELAAAVLAVMKSRKKNPIAAPVNRDSPCSDLFMPGDPSLLTPVQIRDLQRKLDRAFQKALKWLESQELIESDEGYNGKNGIVILTEQGERCELQTDFQNIQHRSLLVPQMLHVLRFPRGSIRGRRIYRIEAARNRSTQEIKTPKGRARRGSHARGVQPRQRTANRYAGGQILESCPDDVVHWCVRTLQESGVARKSGVCRSIGADAGAYVCESTADNR